MKKLSIILGFLSATVFGGDSFFEYDVLCENQNKTIQISKEIDFVELKKTVTLTSVESPVVYDAVLSHTSRKTVTILIHDLYKFYEKFTLNYEDLHEESSARVWVQVGYGTKTLEILQCRYLKNNL